MTSNKIKSLFENTSKFDDKIQMDEFEFYIRNERIEFIKFGNVVYRYIPNSSEVYIYKSENSNDTLRVSIKETKTSLIHLYIRYNCTVNDANSCEYLYSI